MSGWDSRNTKTTRNCQKGGQELVSYRAQVIIDEIRHTCLHCWRRRGLSPVCCANLQLSTTKPQWMSQEIGATRRAAWGAAYLLVFKSVEAAARTHQPVIALENNPIFLAYRDQGRRKINPELRLDRVIQYLWCCHLRQRRGWTVGARGSCGSPSSTRIEWGLFVPAGTARSAAPMPMLAEAVKASPKPAASPVTARTFPDAWEQAHDRLISSPAQPRTQGTRPGTSHGGRNKCVLPAPQKGFWDCSFLQGHRAPKPFAKSYHRDARSWHTCARMTWREQGEQNPSARYRPYKPCRANQAPFPIIPTTSRYHQEMPPDGATAMPREQGKKHQRGVAEPPAGPLPKPPSPSISGRIYGAVPVTHHLSNRRMAVVKNPICWRIRILLALPAEK